MFGRATIRLGIGPHSSFCCCSSLKSSLFVVYWLSFISRKGWRVWLIFLQLLQWFTSIGVFMLSRVLRKNCEQSSHILILSAKLALCTPSVCFPVADSKLMKVREWYWCGLLGLVVIGLCRNVKIRWLPNNLGDQKKIWKISNFIRFFSEWSLNLGTLGLSYIKWTECQSP